MQYIFEKTKEVVKEEKWVWGVIYKDDTELHQFGSDGAFHQIKEIRMDDVKLFTMYKLEDMSKRIDMVVSPEMQLFHFYRNIKPWYLDRFAKVYVFGYKIRGTSKKCYNFILPDDRIIVSDKENVDLVNFALKEK